MKFTITKHNFYTFNRACNLSNKYNIDEIAINLIRYYQIYSIDNCDYFDTKKDRKIFVTRKTFDFKGYTITTIQTSGEYTGIEIVSK
jgi:hypothetical protein